MKGIYKKSITKTWEFSRHRLLLAVFVLLPGFCYSQNSILSLGLWNLTYLSGEVKGGGLYGYGTSNSYGINNTEKISSLYAGLNLKTTSYLWNPNFMTIDLDGGYYPESHQDVYLVFQNRIDNINTRRLHAGLNFFPKKPITVSTYLNLNNSYDSRENLNDIRTNSKDYGATMGLSNKYFPLSLAYDNNNWDTKELNTNHDYHYKQENVEGRGFRSFGLMDRNDLMYTHHDYTREEYDISNPIRNISDNIMLLDNVFLDSAKRSHFNSNISATNQVGNDSFKQFRATENLYYILTKDLLFNGTYGYYYIANTAENLGLNNLDLQLSHQLFESLHTDLLYEYNNTNDNYHEINNKIGVNFMYTKKTFGNGLLTLNYYYSRLHEQHTSHDGLLNMIDEQYTLSDARRTLLKSPYVDSSTVVVKDVTGTIIYINGLDYTLSPVGNYMEILRVPGGQIADNSTVYIWYTARQPGNYNYDVNQNNFSVNYSFWRHLLSVYFKTNRTSYANIHMADYLLLDYLTENLFGACFEYKMARGGVEYDDYQSTITPYKMTRYFLSVQGNYRQRLLYSLNANWRDYNIPGEETDRIYQDASAMTAYAITNRTKVDCNLGYQYQHGRQINLELVTARCRVSTYYYGCTFSGGIDYYDRIYLDNQKTSYIGANLQVCKKFKY